MINHFSCYQLTTDKFIYKKRYLFVEKKLDLYGLLLVYFNSLYGND